MTQHFHILSKVTAEPPALPPVEHTGAHILNAPLFNWKYARVYFGDQESRDPIALNNAIPKNLVKIVTQMTFKHTE
jgi:nuclear pore complex protein Nup93